MSSAQEIDLDPDRINPIDLNRFNPSGTWELQSMTVESLPNVGGVTQLSFTITMKRLKTFYIMNMILPVVFLSLTASMVFYVPAATGEKMGMSITVLLAYAVYVSIISDSMPQTSLQVSVMSVYLNILLGLTSLGVIMGVVVLHVYHKSPEYRIGHRVVKITRLGRRFFGLCRYMEDDDVNTPPRDTPLPSKEPTHWKLPNATNDSSNDWDLPDALAEDDAFHRDGLRSRQQNTPNVGSLAGIRPEVTTPKGSLTKSAWTEHRREEDITWEKVSELIDYVMFTFLSMVIVLLTIAVLLALGIGSMKANSSD